MQEFFYEESSKRERTKSLKIKYIIIYVLMVISYVLSGLWMFIALNSVLINNAWWLVLLLILLPFATFIAMGVLLGKYKNNLIVDYDYTIVSDSVRIAKVKRDVKRNFIMQFITNDIEMMGKVYSETFNKYDEMANIVKKVFTQNTEAQDDKSFYYLVVNYNSEKHLLIFECTEKLLVNILKTARRTVLEKDFTK